RGDWVFSFLAARAACGVKAKALHSADAKRQAAGILRFLTRKSDMYGLLRLDQRGLDHFANALFRRYKYSRPDAVRPAMRSVGSERLHHVDARGPRGRQHRCEHRRS